MPSDLRRRAEWSLAAVCLVWGSSFILVQQALADCSVLLFLALRFSFASVALALFFRGGSWQRGMVWPEFRAGIAAGGSLFAAYFLQTEGLKYTTSTHSAFLTGLNVVMVPLLVSLVYRRVPQHWEIVGAVLATGGMALLTLNGVGGGVNFGDLLSFLCAVAFSVHILLLAHYGQRTGIRNLALLQLVFVALFSILTFWWLEPIKLVWTPRLGGALLWTALVATAFAFSVMVWAQRHTSPARAALIFAAEPVFAWITAYWLTGELLTLRAASGAALILTGILAVELKPIRMAQHPSS